MKGVFFCEWNIRTDVKIHRENKSGIWTKKQINSKHFLEFKFQGFRVDKIGLAGRIFLFQIVFFLFLSEVQKAQK